MECGAKGRKELNDGTLGCIIDYEIFRMLSWNDCGAAGSYHGSSNNERCALQSIVLRTCKIIGIESVKRRQGGREDQQVMLVMLPYQLVLYVFWQYSGLKNCETLRPLLIAQRTNSINNNYASLQV